MNRFPSPFPPAFADSWGDDAYGLFIDVTIQWAQGAATQRLRWIEPGEFLMGSPESEPERGEDEGPQHRVTLTQGYWLADTACAQGFWMAIMDRNPNRFKGEDLPVEQVSWDEVQPFLRKLETQLPGAVAALPTEAEWEYACRAGTTTPFHWCDTISPAQANYDGNFPYAYGAKGEYRGKTLPVRSFLPNAWGLYQMHGNVWEWCADERRAYDGEAQVDPRGQGRGAPAARRALRGGAWSSNAWGLRSASRNAAWPGRSRIDVGFRFVLRSIEPGPG